MGLFNKPKKEIPGKLYNFSNEEKEAIKKCLVIIEHANQNIDGQNALLRIYYRTAARRVGLPDTQYTKINLENFTFLVPEIPRPPVPGPEEKQPEIK